MSRSDAGHLVIGECPNCGQRFYGLWVLGEARLELHCPSCARVEPGASGKMVTMRIVPILSKKGGEW